MPGQVRRWSISLALVYVGSPSGCHAGSTGAQERLSLALAGNVAGAGLGGPDWRHPPAGSFGAVLRHALDRHAASASGAICHGRWREMSRDAGEAQFENNVTGIS